MIDLHNVEWSTATVVAAAVGVTLLIYAMRFFVTRERCRLCHEAQDRALRLELKANDEAHQSMFARIEERRQSQDELRDDFQKFLVKFETLDRKVVRTGRDLMWIRETLQGVAHALKVSAAVPPSPYEDGEGD